jgi:hypothetical protein
MRIKLQEAEEQKHPDVSNIPILKDATPCSLVKWCRPFDSFLFGLVFDAENRGSKQK